MRFIAHGIILVIAQAVALSIAGRIISGFQITNDLKELILLALLFAALSITVRPLLKLMLGPLIILTLGVGLIIVNAIILYALDFFSQSITIQSIPALIYGTLVISLVNFIFHLGTQRK